MAAAFEAATDTLRVAREKGRRAARATVPPARPLTANARFRRLKGGQLLHYVQLSSTLGKAKAKAGGTAETEVPTVVDGDWEKGPARQTIIRLILFAPRKGFQLKTEPASSTTTTTTDQPTTAPKAGVGAATRQLP